VESHCPNIYSLKQPLEQLCLAMAPLQPEVTVLMLQIQQQPVYLMEHQPVMLMEI
jgi:hypothetical protein